MIKVRGWVACITAAAQIAIMVFPVPISALITTAGWLWSTSSLTEACTASACALNAWRLRPSMMAWRRWCTAVPSSSSGSKMAGFCDLTCDSRPSPNSSMKSASLMFSPNPSPSAPLSLGVSTSSGMSVSLFNVVSPTTSMLATSLIGLSRNCRDSAPQGHESLRVVKNQRPRPLFICVAPLGGV